MNGRLALRLAAIGYVLLLLALPVGLIVYRAFAGGVPAAWQAMTNPDALHALWLTALIALIAVPLNAAFGVLCSIVLVRHNIRGKAFLGALVDLPLGLSPVVVGLALVVVYGRYGWLGPWLADRGYAVIFAVPGMVLATILVTLPFVVRETVPVLHEIGTDQEQAAATLGASPLQIFMRITLPAIRSGVGYGVVLTTARALGEFGAVSVVSGNIIGETQTLTLYVQDRFQSFDSTGAYTASLELAVLALLILPLMSLLRKKERS
ncbi:MAG TPA: sulfate ABC transporter permease subunit [Chloroflexota bacterium]|nr:sulfate ABC transporter permease subunit [Chloroflexota bacterium]